MGWTDKLVGAFSPKAEANRLGHRARGAVLVEATRTLRTRSYDGARHSRLTRDWRASTGSADAIIGQDLPTLRSRSRDLVRNNPYIASAVRQLVANLVGDGIEARAQHADPRIQKLAQEVYGEWALTRVDGRHDWYGIQRQAVRSMIVDGDIAVVWSSRNGQPDALLTLIEGDQMASPQAGILNRTPRIRDGVQYDVSGVRAAYHFLETHPGDLLGNLLRKTRVVEAQHVDHLFDPERAGQSRGVPWVCPSMTKVRELQDLADSIRMKKKMQACIGIIRTLAADDDDDPDTGVGEEGGEEPIGSGSPALERMSPGMVVEGLPGEQFTTIQPTADGDSDVFYRQEWRSVAASIGIPDHLMTGDVGQANYSSLRAATVAFWTLLDDWQSNVVVPFLLDPAFERLMRRKAVELREPKLAEVKARWTPPPRFWVDPVKDVAALVMEERAGYINKPEALARRGINWREHFEERAMVQAEADRLQLAFDTDPRQVSRSGVTQARPQGSVLPTGEEGDEAARSTIGDPVVVGFFGRMIEAIEAGDHAALNSGFVEAATALRSGSPAGPAMVAIIAAVTGADEPENREV